MVPWVISGPLVRIRISLWEVCWQEKMPENLPFDFALGGKEYMLRGLWGANGTLLREGTTVMADMSGNYTAYQTDMTRVFSIGNYRTGPTGCIVSLWKYRLAWNERQNPGCPVPNCIGMLWQWPDKKGLKDCFMGTHLQAKFVGHGVGLEINELPVLTTRSKDILQPGMTFAFEPKFVLAGIGAVGIENTFLVTDSGVEKMTLLDENIIEL